MKAKTDINSIDHVEAKKVNRREFLRLFAGVVAAAGYTSIFQGCDTSTRKVCSAWIPQGGLANSYSLFKSTVESATDLSALKKTDSIFIKIAIDSSTGYPACTDPVALGFMLKLLKEKGAQKIYVGGQTEMNRAFSLVNTVQSQEVLAKASAAGSKFMQMVFNILETDQIRQHTTRTYCTESGLLDVINGAGAVPVFVDELSFSEFKAVTVSGGNWASSIYIPKFLSDITHIVSMPASVEDSVFGIYSGLINMTGLLRNDCRLAMKLGSVDDYFRMCVDANLVSDIESKLRLTVTSGMSILTTSGADQGTDVEPDYGLLYASDYILAHDLMAAAWVEANRAEINTGADIYALPALDYYIDKNGSEDFSWKQINADAGSATINLVKNYLKV